MDDETGIFNENFIDIIKEREIGKYIENASMKRFTSYKVGGVARCVVYPKNTKKLTLFI